MWIEQTSPTDSRFIQAPGIIMNCDSHQQINWSIPDYLHQFRCTPNESNMQRFVVDLVTFKNKIYSKMSVAAAGEKPAIKKQRNTQLRQSYKKNTLCARRTMMLACPMCRIGMRHIDFQIDRISLLLFVLFFWLNISHFRWSVTWLRVFIKMQLIIYRQNMSFL